MSTITAADKRLRSASAALERGLLPDPDGFAVDPDLERLAGEQQHLQAAVASLLVKMQEPGLDGRELDRLARGATHMLALAEDLRQVRAKTAARRAGAARAWRTRLDVD